MKRILLQLAALFAMSLALVACGGGSETVATPPTGSTPTIGAFGASPATITVGQSTTLNWSTTDATSVSISPGVGSVTGSSTAVAPTSTTVYTLTATNSNGSSTANATVTVNAGSGGSAPTIASFTASPASIQSGQSSTLSWSVSNATSLSIAGIGAVTGTSRSVSPTSTTTYTLTATNSNGSTTANATVTVTTGSAPTIATFTATPSTITSGQSSTLSWSVSNASSLSISGIGTVTGTSRSVSPTTTTTYTLTATNGNGNATASATVTVGTGSTSWTYGSMAAANLGIGANLNGAVPFPANNAWNTDISSAPVDPNSANIIASIGNTTTLHADFGAGLYNGAKIGIPYIVVPGSQTLVTINFNAYGDESDPGPYPIPPNAPVEGEPNAGDRHVLVIDRDNNRLYELGNGYKQTDNSWLAYVGAIFHLDSNNVRPGGQAGWTSADAAGLPIFPGLVRYDEATSGTIPHALRFTVQTSRKAYVPPATHWASSNTSANLPPMGMRVRLKSSFVIPSNFSTEGKAILQAMKKYGMLMADNGGNWFISGAPDERWDNDALRTELGSVKGSDFEVIRMDGLVTP